MIKSKTACGGVRVPSGHLCEAEAPTEPAGENGCGQLRCRMGQIFAQPVTAQLIPLYQCGKVEHIVIAVAPNTFFSDALPGAAPPANHITFFIFARY